ncbi:MAG TPA: alpha/beta hydrolase [Candidatus Bathyarchaeia archaeon]|jgi:pimeloyl-ACP methyl ester carboxylesterase|nr:alpha/beta hydrolase [Candidatus Bathyarchaeia archaeon]
MLRSTGEFVVKVGGVEICVEALGDRADAPVLLIQGACASMLRWEEGFCERLVAGGRYVIRYDNRDVGRSTAYPPGNPPYDLEDLAEDAVGVLEALGIASAHVAGASSGGMIGQLVAIRYPKRVRTLTLLISTPTVPDAAKAVESAAATPTVSDLPAPSAALIEKVKALASVDWRDPHAAVEAFVAEAHAMAGTGFPVDDSEVRAWAPREYARQKNILSFRYNTPIAETKTAAWRHRLAEIQAPTLVVHGTDDPVLPYAHGVALSREIPQAKLLTIEGMGHELPRGAWPRIVGAILEHTA